MRIVRAQKLREAVALINALGSDRIYYAHDPNDRGNAPAYDSPTLGRMESEPPSPKWLRDWLGDEYFVTATRVWIFGRDREGDHNSNQLDDDKLAFILEAMPKLRNLSIGNSIITDAGFEKLARLHELERLSLDHSHVLTDSAFAGLANNGVLNYLYLFDCPHMTWGALRHLDGPRDTLTMVELGGPEFGDEGANVLNQFPNLTTLNLFHSPISDDSISLLSTLTSLTRLGLADTSVTPQGAEQIKRALPTCKVIHLNRSGDEPARAANR